MSRTFWAHMLCAFLVSFMIICFQAMKEAPDLTLGDSAAYMHVAKGLVETGVFTDGYYQDKAAVIGEKGQGMFFAPLYPWLIAQVMKLDPVFDEAVSCYVAFGEGGQCKTDVFGAFHYVQIVLAGISAFLVWLSAWMITRRFFMAWLALLLCLSAKCYADYTGQIMTENLVFPLFNAVSFLAVCAWIYKKWLLWFACGICFGLLVLSRPPFLYMFYAALPALIVLCVLNKGVENRKAILWCISLVVGMVLTISPWLIRNAQTFGHTGITKGYASFILAQRVSYNDMSMTEFAASFIYGLPDFGDNLVSKFFDEKDYARFDYDNSDGFYIMGYTDLFEQTMQKAGGRDAHLRYLIDTYILAQPVQHILTTLSLAWRGMWVSKYWGLIAIPLFLGAFVYALRRGWTEFLIFALPPWFMLGFHAFTSVNVVRYNLILVPCLAVGAAFVLTALFDRIKGKIDAKA